MYFYYNFYTKALQALIKEQAIPKFVGRNKMKTWDIQNELNSYVVDYNGINSKKMPSFHSSTWRLHDLEFETLKLKTIF
jgi:hypothetical protein